MRCSGRQQIMRRKAMVQMNERLFSDKYTEGRGRKEVREKLEERRLIEVRDAEKMEESGM